MGPYIQHIATAVPEASYSQEMLRDQMKRYLGDDRRTQAILHRVYAQSGINQRHSVVDDFSSPADSPLFFNGTDTPYMPSTGERNRIYEEKSKPLFTAAGQKVIDETGIDPASITHVITVSCTGFFAPGPDYHLLRSLNLLPNVHRFHIGFMGCFASFPALNMAKAFSEADPEAVVLIVGAELCTLHFQDATDTDNLIAGSVFADGAAGVLVSAKPLVLEHPVLSIDRLNTQVTSTGEQDMAWTIGDTGFRMKLSTYVPDIIQSNLSEILSDYQQSLPDPLAHIPHWAVHPGGRAILDKVQEGMQLDKSQLQASRNVLAEFGNMSSVTVLFVLKEILNQSMESDGKPETVLGMAFGPGLTVESGLFTKQNLRSA
jgi:predicted naringenin-chalcone synthase